MVCARCGATRMKALRLGVTRVCARSSRRSPGWRWPRCGGRRTERTRTRRTGPARQGGGGHRGGTAPGAATPTPWRSSSSTPSCSPRASVPPSRRWRCWPARRGWWPGRRALGPAATGPRGGCVVQTRQPRHPAAGGGGVGRPRRAGRRGARGAPGPGPAARSAPWPWCRGRPPTPTAPPCDDRAPDAVEVRGPVDGDVVGAGPRSRRACATSWPSVPRPAGPAAGGGRPGAGLRVRHGPALTERARPARGGPGTMARMSRYSIRLYGDPVLRQRAPEVEDIDGTLKQLADDMVQTMYEAPGVGLAAPQVGVQKRMFVYDTGDGEGPVTVVNPVLAEARGEWTFDEGCLSVPGPVVAHRAPQGGAPHRVRPRRQRDLDRGRRVPGPGVPARGRPPRRRAARGAPRRGPAQGGQAHPAHPGARPARRGSRRVAARSPPTSRPARHTGL